MKPSLDPRYLIARATRFADHDVADDRHAVILQLPEPQALPAGEALAAIRQALVGQGEVEQAYLGACEGLRIATATVTTLGLARLEQLLRTGAGDRPPVLERFEYAQVLRPPRIRRVDALRPPPVPPAPGPAADEPDAAASSSRPRVLLAVIDHGCPFAHPLLRRGALSTRVRALWDQQPGQGPGRPPLGFSYGCELRRPHLDAALAAAQGDEDEAYRLVGYEALRARRSHGAHALGMLLGTGLAAAGEEGSAWPGEVDVVFVQLPQGVQAAPSRAALSRHAIDALRWIEGQRRPGERIVLSASKGSSQGPNDGTSMVELALDAFCAAGEGADRVYIAAGNGRNEDLHASLRPKPGEPRTLIWRVPPGAELPPSVELWVPDARGSGDAGLSVEVIAPHGECVARVRPGQLQQWPDAASPVLSVAFSHWRGRGCTECLIRLAPTASCSGRPPAPAGDWGIRLVATRPLKADVHLYIGRVKPALGFPLRAAQSIFVAARVPGVVGPDETGTLQGLATARRVRAAGGVVGAQRRRPAPYSALGPSRDRVIEQPAHQVLTDDGDHLRGRRSIGNRAGITFRMDGTSVAAPLAARLHGREEG